MWARHADTRSAVQAALRAMEALRCAVRSTDARRCCQGCMRKRIDSQTDYERLGAERSEVGAKAEAGATRVKPELAETAREQRASRGVAAGREGKALKAEILWADVARNKATRLRRAQTAEGVRNPESGRCRRGKPAQRSPGFIRRKEPNPMGDVVGFPLRVSRLRTTSVGRGWEASFGRASRVSSLR
jgi:hypothetical protein